MLPQLQLALNVKNVTAYSIDLPDNQSTEYLCHYLKENYAESWRYAYMRIYYCSAINHLILANILLWAFIIIVIGLLFLVLGILASDYLVPNLSALSDILKMDEKLAGLTLLAFANGSPDILSTYIAMNEGVTTMAIGELLGSANFALTVVIGVLAIFKPFKVNQRTFIRDLVIFSTLMMASLYIMSDGVITILESCVLCLLYVIFILLNIFLPEHDHFEAYPCEAPSTSEEINRHIENEYNTIDRLTEENVNSLPACGTQLGARNGKSDSNNSDDRSYVSMESNRSMNDYYFAHNIDNLEQGRGYKIALLDSLKLAWLWRRKNTLRNVIIENEDVERLDHMQTPTIQYSPESSQTLDFTNELCADSVEEPSSTGLVHTSKTPTRVKPKPTVPSLYTQRLQSLPSLQTHLDDTIQPSSPSPCQSRAPSVLNRKKKNGDSYQILYPSRQSSSSRMGSPLVLRSEHAPCASHLDNRTPTITVGPQKASFHIIDEDVESQAHEQEHDEEQDSGGRPKEPTTQLLGAYKQATGNDIDGSALLTLEDGERLNSESHNFLQPPSRLSKENSTHSCSLIPYVEYQRTENIIYKIIPFHVYTSSATFQEKLLSIIIIPFSVVFNLIVPLPLPTELQGPIHKHELELSIKLFHFQATILPIVMTDFDYSIYVIALVLVLPATTLVLQRKAPAFFNYVFPVVSSIVGFCAVLKLITFTASAIIAVLKDLAQIYSLSESILGLTILSMGNSIGDVVTNLALAGLGRPLTGLHACFGSPLLYILFGVGICSLIVQLTSSGHPMKIEFTVERSLELTAISIICMLVFYSVVVPLSGWKFQRWMGLVGVCVWFSVTVANFVLHGYR
jgi:Ca2+/Na+ antiporter